MSYKLFRFNTAFEGFFSGVKLLLVVVIALILFGFFLSFIEYPGYCPGFFSSYVASEECTFIEYAWGNTIFLALLGIVYGWWVIIGVFLIFVYIGYRNSKK